MEEQIVKPFNFDLYIFPLVVFGHKTSAGKQIQHLHTELVGRSYKRIKLTIIIKFGNSLYHA